LVFAVRHRPAAHLDHLLPRPPKLARGHHAAIPYEDVAAFIAKLRKRDAISALALKRCILTAARSGEISVCGGPKSTSTRKSGRFPQTV
jgi:integrase